jgi:hypothetical protein
VASFGHQCKTEKPAIRLQWLRIGEQTIEAAFILNLKHSEAHRNTITEAMIRWPL